MGNAMTPLPKHLEEIKNEFSTLELGEHCYPFERGFDHCYILMSYDLESMAKALEDYASEVPSETRINRDGFHTCKPAMGTKAREALKDYREKYGDKK